MPDALAEFETLLATNPNYLPGCVHYGIALYSAGRKSDAVRVWEDVLATQPGHKGAEMYLNLVRDVQSTPKESATNGGLP